MIELRGLTKTYRQGTAPVPVLRALTLKIEPGEFVAIVGQSGSGKSTLLNVLGLLDRYDDGEYVLAGESTRALSPTRAAQLRNRHIGFVFQSFNLLPFKTALDNVSLPLFYRRQSRAARESAAQRLLERVGLRHRAQHRPTEMSGGEQQRVAIARALIGDPAVILADEPTGNLDAHTAEQIFALLHEVNRDGKTVVIVTHDASMARRVQRTIRLHQGRTVEADRAS